jgi:hypothetical protein
LKIFRWRARHLTSDNRFAYRNRSHFLRQPVKIEKLKKEGNKNQATMEKVENVASAIRHIAVRKQHKFDTSTLPADLQRVYGHLKKVHGEEYALTFIFIFNTGVELHRAWHMTLLTTKILQQVKDKLGVRMTWELGVLKLKFRVEDGTFEIHRKVPYDYDSEFQDIYMRIAVALSDGEITIYEALNYQAEVKQGKHTAKTGLFIRDFPGRLVVYPVLALTCTVIFFGGDWTDAGIAAICGIVCGIIEWFLSEGLGGEAKILIDIIIGTVTGIIGSLFYRFGDQSVCLSAVFLGNLYWYFYGTAFVIGILEIIAGELEVGVTRFIAVSVKTFVLCLGASLGMLVVLEDASDTWNTHTENCGLIDLDAKWWRIPLYLLCSAGALAQYRFQVIRWWRGLAVQLVGYEVQYRMQVYFGQFHAQDFLDTATSNILGAAAAVCTACLLSWGLDQLRYYYYGRLLQRDQEDDAGAMGDFAYNFVAGMTQLVTNLGLGRPADVAAQKLGEKISKQSQEMADPVHPRGKIELTEEEEQLTVSIIVDAQDHNIWAVLMPAVYQLVPGSLIARMWFTSIFPPPLVTQQETIPGTDFTYTTYSLDANSDNIFSNLMVISTSLALGLIIGFAIVQAFESIFCGCGICTDSATDIYGGVSGESKREKQKARRAGMYTTDNDDPQTIQDEIKPAKDMPNSVVNEIIKEEEKEEESGDDSQQEASA